MVFAAWSINHLSLAALDTAIQRLNPLSCHSARRRTCARCGGCGREEEGKEKEEKEKEKEKENEKEKGSDRHRSVPIT